MSRFDKYLTEAVFRKLSDMNMKKFDEITKMIKKDCSQYYRFLIKNFKNKKVHNFPFLWRGTYARGDADISKVIPRKNRQPKDMPGDLHEILDDYFYKKFGWRPRSEGVFCAAARSTAEGYGDRPFLIFPFDGYKYLWNKKVDDLYSKMEGSEYFGTPEDQYYFEDEYYQEYEEGDGNGTYYYEGEDTGESSKEAAVAEVVDSLYDEYREDDQYDELDEYNLRKVIEYDVEGKLEWVPDKTLEEFTEKKIEEWESNRDDYLKDLVSNYTNKNLEVAMTNHPKHEIMIDCKAYYIVHSSWQNYLAMYLSKGGIQLELPFEDSGDPVIDEIFTVLQVWAFYEHENMNVGKISNFDFKHEIKQFNPKIRHIVHFSTERGQRRMKWVTKPNYYTGNTSINDVEWIVGRLFYVKAGGKSLASLKTHEAKPDEVRIKKTNKLYPVLT